MCNHVATLKVDNIEYFYLRYINVLVVLPKTLLIFSAALLRCNQLLICLLINTRENQTQRSAFKHSLSPLAVKLCLFLNLHRINLPLLG